MNTKINIVMIMGISLVITSMTGMASAEKSIDIFSLQSEVAPTESIRVAGFVNAESFYKPVKLEVYDPNGKLLFIPDVRFNDDGQFSWVFYPPLGKFDVTGTYTIIASHEEISDTAHLQFSVVDTSSNNPWLETVMMNSNSFENTISQYNAIKVQPTKETIQPDNEIVMTQSNAFSTKMQDSLAPTQPESMQASDVQSMQMQESPVIITAIALSIAGIFSGVVIWMRMRHAKPIVQK